MGLHYLMIILTDVMFRGDINVNVLTDITVNVLTKLFECGKIILMKVLTEALTELIFHGVF